MWLKCNPCHVPLHKRVGDEIFAIHFTLLSSPPARVGNCRFNHELQRERKIKLLKQSRTSIHQQNKHVYNEWIFDRQPAKAARSSIQSAAPHILPDGSRRVQRKIYYTIDPTSRMDALRGEYHGIQRRLHDVRISPVSQLER